MARWTATGTDLARPRVRFLVHGAERSGPPVHVLRLCRAWADRDPGFDREVVLARPGELVTEFAALAPTRVARLDRRSPETLAARGLAATGVPSAGVRLRRAATARRVDHGPADVTVVNGATAPTAELLRVLDPAGPVAVIGHELSTGWFGNLTAPDRGLLLDRCSDAVAVSEAVRDLLVDLGMARTAIRVIPPAVELPDPPVPAGGDVGDRSVVTVAGGGETDWRKAPDLWLLVAARAVELAPPGLDLRFRWFGGSTTRTPAGWPLQHEVRHLGLEDRVEFLGQQDDPWSALGRVDLFLSTAREDAAPLACAEAAARGVPVLSFDSGGNVELVRDGGCGVVVPYPRTDELADALVALACDPGRRRELGCAGATFVRERRSVEVVSDMTGAWLRELAG